MNNSVFRFSPSTNITAAANILRMTVRAPTPDADLCLQQRQTVDGLKRQPISQASESLQAISPTLAKPDAVKISVSKFEFETDSRASLNRRSLKGLGLFLHWRGSRGVDLRAAVSRHSGDDLAANVTAGMNGDDTLSCNRIWSKTSLCLMNT